MNKRPNGPRADLIEFARDVSGERAPQAGRMGHETSTVLQRWRIEEPVHSSSLPLMRL